MRFALLGDHPDGLAFATALAETGRHEIVYSGVAAPMDAIREAGTKVRRLADLEEVLADPVVEAVIVAGKPGDRPAQLRRALQSERHVVCVHPADATADLAYEAAMIRQDTGCVLMPLLAESLHPGVVRLAELAAAKDGPLGVVRLVEMERWSPERVLTDTDPGGHKAAVPGWDVLRALCGEVGEVSAFAACEEAASDEPLLLTGKFESGPLFQAAFLPGQSEVRWRLAVVGSRGTATLTFPQGWPGPARLTWADHEENWDGWQPGPALVEVFESSVGDPAMARIGAGSGDTAITATRPAGANPKPRLTWQDAVRCLELDGAVRRSVHYRRASALEYQDATEEVGFKGTMTLLGCGLLWGLLLLLVVAVWEPRLFWLSVPLLGGFLLLQLLRWVVPAKEQAPPPQGPGPG